MSNGAYETDFRLYTLGEVAQSLHITDGYLRRLRREGLIPQPIIIGKSKRYSHEQLQAILNRAHILAGFNG